MLPRYEIVREIGRGAMGVVALARDTVSGAPVALKTIPAPLGGTEADRARAEIRFLGEVAVAARLSHPHIVRVLDSGRDPDTGALYIAFEHVDGASLAEVVTPAAPLPWPQALRIAERVAGALAHAHAQGVVHRDVKPSNILLTASGEPKLVDFGIAAVAEAWGAIAPGAPQAGTPLYLSPEQALGLPMDARSDVFALGSVLYFLLTGRAPFVAGSIRSILLRIVREDPLPPSRFIRDLPGDLDDVVRRAMAKNPAERYPDARTLAEDVEDVLGGRPPRHRDRWAPPLAAQTIPFSPADPEALLRELEEELRVAAFGDQPAPDLAALAGAGRPPSFRAPGRRTRLAATVGLALLGGAAVGFAPWKGPEPAPPAVQASLARTVSLTPAPTQAALASTVSLAKPAVAAEQTMPPAPRVALPALPPTPVALPTFAASPPPLAPARLAFEFQHPLKSGRLRLFVDGEVLLDERLESRERRKAVAFKSRKGSLGEILEVAPGERDLRLEVSWDGETRTETVRATFLAGESRRLAARLGGVLKRASRWSGATRIPARRVNPARVIRSGTDTVRRSLTNAAPPPGRLR
jgi:serine/threonine-protein kinase